MKRLSVFCLLVPETLLFVISGVLPAISGLSLSLLAGASILIELPVSDESAKSSFFSAILLTTVYSTFRLCDAGFRIVAVSIMAAVLVDLAFKSICRYSRIRPLFKQSAVRYAFEDHVRLMYALFLFLLGTLMVAGHSSRWILIAVASLLAALYVILLLRSRRGVTMIFRREVEDSLNNMLNGELSDNRTAYGPDEPDAMTSLYDRIIAFMDGKKPYLDEEYSLKDLAKDVFTNKTYLSKTINVMSGKNYRQFLNSYRVEYSINLMKEDKHLKVSEVASMSGFHTVVTYNMAFKVNKGVTPGEYLSNLRVREL